MTLQIAHFSDAHLLSLKGAKAHQFLNKRWTGGLNLLLNRGKHYQLSIFKALCSKLQTLSPDHNVCTGDLVNLAFQSEFDQVAPLLAQFFDATLLSMVPGNHDRYIREAMGRFESSFAPYLHRDLNGLDATSCNCDAASHACNGASCNCDEASHACNSASCNCDEASAPLPCSNPDAHYPFVTLGEGFAIVGLCSAEPRPIWMADGQLGKTQLEKLRLILESPALQGRTVILALHHPPRDNGIRSFGRDLRDTHALQDLLLGLKDEHKPSVILAGHDHKFRIDQFAGIPFVQCDSAADDRRAGFNLCCFESNRLTTVQRYLWNADRFDLIETHPIEAPSSPL